MAGSAEALGLAVVVYVVEPYSRLAVLPDSVVLDQHSMRSPALHINVESGSSRAST